MLVFTQSFVKNLGRWLTQPPERFMMVAMIISFIYFHSGILMLTSDWRFFWLRDFLHAFAVLAYGYVGYCLLKRREK